MADGPQELPNEQDFDPWGGQLDAQWAWKKFGGLTLDEANELFRDQPFTCQEDLMWMGGRAFAYYFPVVESYIKDKKEREEREFGFICECLASSIQSQFDWNTADVIHLAPRVLELADLIQSHLDKFASKEEERKRLNGAWRELRYAINSALADRKYEEFRPNNYTMSKFAARLHILLAREAPLGVVIRRGPSKRVATLLWDRRTDKFELGQWLKGRIYERRSDLSPYGKHLIYFAMNGKHATETRGSWTAISRAPYLKADVLLGKGDCWHGGGLWTSDCTYWLNDGYGHEVLRDTPAVQRDNEYRPEMKFGGECPGVYYPRLLRDGWKLHDTLSAELGDARTVFERPLMQGWFLRKIAQAGAPAQGRGCYWDEHALVQPATNRTIAFPDWEWAERDGDRLVWATEGRLYAAELDSCGPKPKTMLYDFNEMEFEPIEAPY